MSLLIRLHVAYDSFARHLRLVCTSLTILSVARGVLLSVMS